MPCSGGQGVKRELCWKARRKSSCSDRMPTNSGRDFLASCRRGLDLVIHSYKNGFPRGQPECTASCRHVENSRPFPSPLGSRCAHPVSAWGPIVYTLRFNCSEDTGACQHCFCDVPALCMRGNTGDTSYGFSRCLPEAVLGVPPPTPSHLGLCSPRLHKKSGARWLCACVSRQDDELDETPEILSDSRR